MLRMTFRHFTFSLVLLVSTASLAAARVAPAKSAFETWLATQTKLSERKLLANISPADGAPGAVIASPERVTPNYYFHWVRDAALTMDVVLDLYDRATGSDKAALREHLIDYLRFSRGNQTTAARTGMGEPKFNVDGSAFNGDWCRPQNDGPALRAVTLIRLARRLLSVGESQLVRDEIYDGKIPTHSVVKADLEFVAHHWREKSCDIWEEVEGDHLYTRLAQHRALEDGATLATDLGDPAAAHFYRSQAAELRVAIAKHWDATRGLLLPTIGRSGGLDSKKSDLDSQVILGLLHGSGIAIDDTRAIATMKAQSETFARLYSINFRSGAPGVAIGRYPEDVYDGDRFEGGNPWVLTTAAFATAHYAISLAALDNGDRIIADRELSSGDEYLERIRYHSMTDGSLSEQLNRDTGFMTSARDLTWSHAELIRAAHAREKLISKRGASTMLPHPWLRRSPRPRLETCS